MEKKELYDFEIKLRQSYNKEEITAEFLADMVNGNFSGKKFAEYLNYQHKTLQQQVFSLFLHFCKRLTEDDALIDGRNEISANLAKKIMEITDGGTYLPLI